MNDTRFSMIPLIALTDDRLTLRMLKTLAAICSFRTSSSDICVHASREEIARRCGFNPSIVSTATTALQRLGWLAKTGSGGRGMKTTYTITIPETESTSGTVTESETVLKSGTVSENKTVPHSVSKTVPDSGTLPYTREKERASSISAPDGFDLFWDAYGKKVGKAAAVGQWKKLKPNRALVQLIVSAAKRYAASTESKFRKDPERWIRDRRWEDEPMGREAVSEDSIFAGAL